MDAFRKIKSKNEGEVKSIRRQSFIETFGIKEVEEDEDFIESFGVKEEDDDAKSAGSIDFLDSREGVGVDRQSLTIEDLDDVDIDFLSSQNGNGSMDVSLLGNSSINDMDVDANQGPSLRRPSYNYKSSDSQDAETESSSQPKNFAGGNTRRKGDKQRRMRQRFGLPPETRRASTGTMTGMMEVSFAESLASFTSINSFSSSIAGDPTKTVAVGNLIFVTDAEMATLMYGDDDAVKKKDSPEKRRSSISSVSSACSDISTSLPPSATLGTGAFSTVRLAWRKTTEQKEKDEKKRASLQDIAEKETEHELRRRSVVRVQSNTNDVDQNVPPQDKGQLVAVKIMQKSILKQMKTIQKGPNNRMTVLTAFDNIEREIATMKRLHHPNLVRLYEVIDSVESDRMHMVLEYVSLGEILSHVEGTNKYTRMRYRKMVKGLTERGHFDEKHAALYFVDIMHGLAYLHRHRICHRDLKPENILLCASGIVKISDFGVAHIFEDEKMRESYFIDALDDESLDDMLSDCKDNDFSMRIDDEPESPTHLSKRESDAALTMGSKFNRGTLTKTEGTWCFWSPEMCNTENKGFSGYASDLWAAGVCLYIFTTGMLPFFSMIPTDLFDQIANEEVQYEGLSLSNELMNILDRLLDKNPATRAGVGDCLKHAFCADARIERINQFGSRFNESEEHIILSKNEVDMALSVTMGPKHDIHRKLSKRRSAPASSLSSPPAALANARKLKSNNPNLPILTEAPMEMKAPKSSDKPKKLEKRVSLLSKLKQKWFGRG